MRISKLQEKTQENKIMFRVKLRDRHGRERLLEGLVEEGLTRNQALAQLVQQHGGKCEIREGTKELKGLTWIAKIEFNDGYKIEEWGQYRTENGELEYRKVSLSLTQRLMNVFFKKFETTSFWENGDTKRVTKNDNFVIFSEDYGVKADLPSPDELMRTPFLERHTAGGCGGSLKEGEIELVKMAARIDLKGESYAVDLCSGKITKREQESSSIEVDIEKILAASQTSQRWNKFDSSAIRPSLPLFVLFPKILPNAHYNRAAALTNDSDLFFANVFNSKQDIAHMEAMPNLFFSRYQNDIAREETREEKKEESREAAANEEEEEEKKSKKTARATKNEKAAEDNAGKSDALESSGIEREKINSILNKLREGGEDKSELKKSSEKIIEKEDKKEVETEVLERTEKTGEKAEEKELPRKAKEKEKKKEEEKKAEKAERVRSEKNKKKQPENKEKNSEKDKEKKKEEKKSESEKKKRDKQKDKRKEAAEKKKEEKKNEKIKKATMVKAIKQVEKKQKKQEKKLQQQASEKKLVQKLVQKKQKIKKIKLPKIKIKIKKVKPLKIKKLDKAARKGAQTAHQLYLAALKKLEKKKKIKKIVLQERKRKKSPRK